LTRCSKLIKPFRYTSKKSLFYFSFGLLSQFILAIYSYFEWNLHIKPYTQIYIHARKHLIRTSLCSITKFKSFFYLRLIDDELIFCMCSNYYLFYLFRQRRYLKIMQSIPKFSWIEIKTLKTNRLNYWEQLSKERNKQKIYLIPSVFSLSFFFLFVFFYNSFKLFINFFF